MRIKSLNYMLFSALAASLTCYAAAAPSQAAIRGAGVSQAAPVMAAPKAGARDHNGIACKKNLRSTPHNRAAKICVMLNFDDAQADLQVQALVNFAVKSGKIKHVCAKHLNLWDNGNVVRSVSKVCKKGGGQKNFISTHWWGVNPPFLNHVFQAGVYHPCIYWTDGSRVCVRGWLKGSKYWD